MPTDDDTKKKAEEALDGIKKGRISKTQKDRKASRLTLPPAEPIGQLSDPKPIPTTDRYIGAPGTVYMRRSREPVGGTAAKSSGSLILPSERVMAEERAIEERRVADEARAMDWTNYGNRALLAMSHPIIAAAMGGTATGEAIGNDIPVATGAYSGESSGRERGDAAGSVVGSHIPESRDTKASSPTQPYVNVTGLYTPGMFADKETSKSPRKR